MLESLTVGGGGGGGGGGRVGAQGVIDYFDSVLIIIYYQIYQLEKLLVK